MFWVNIKVSAVTFNLHLIRPNTQPHTASTTQSDKTKALSGVRSTSTAVQNIYFHPFSWLDCFTLVWFRLAVHLRSPQVAAIAPVHIYRLFELTPLTSGGTAPHVENHSQLRLQRSPKYTKEPCAERDRMCVCAHVCVRVWVSLGL